MFIRQMEFCKKKWFIETIVNFYFDYFLFLESFFNFLFFLFEQ